MAEIRTYTNGFGRWHCAVTLPHIPPTYPADTDYALTLARAAIRYEVKSRNPRDRAPRIALYERSSNGNFDTLTYREI